MLSAGPNALVISRAATSRIEVRLPKSGVSLRVDLWIQMISIFQAIEFTTVLGFFLGGILLLFIYLEIGAMVGIYFKTTRLPVRYLIYVAITALGRVLIEIVGAEHRTGIDILIITGAILLLSFAVLVLRFGSYKYPSERPAADLAR